MCRAAAKARTRQWDLPKALLSDIPGKAAEHERSRGHRLPSFAPELILNELLYRPLHFQDPHGATTSSGKDSAFRQAELCHHMQTESSEVNVASAQQERCTTEEQAAIETLATMQGLAAHSGTPKDFTLWMVDLLRMSGSMSYCPCLLTSH
jgi:hypothetical protein